MSRILIYAVYVMAVLSMIVQMNDGITIELEWSAEGLESYTDPSNPLRAELGDVLILTCVSISNVFIQEEFIQYDTCNASAGSGQFIYNGFCNPDLGLNRFTYTLVQHSQPLNNAVNFVDNSLFYFTTSTLLPILQPHYGLNQQAGSLQGLVSHTIKVNPFPLTSCDRSTDNYDDDDDDDDYAWGSGYYNGVPNEVANPSINTGGQCEDGIKFILAIGDVPLPSAAPDTNINSTVTDTEASAPITAEGGLRSEGTKSTSSFVYLCHFIVILTYLVNP